MNGISITCISEPKMHFVKPFKKYSVINGMNFVHYGKLNCLDSVDYYNFQQQIVHIIAWLVCSCY